MDIEVVDYSPAWLATESRSPAKYGGKFILLTDGQRRVYAFSPIALSKYHGNIAERFLTARGIGGHYGRNEGYRPDRGPWTIPGGARWEFDSAIGTLRLYGVSYGYGPLPLDESARDLASVDAFAGATISIG